MVVRITLAALLSILAAIATSCLLTTLGPDWTRYLPATCQATRCFCEFPRTGEMILQPANSWSSFAFVLVGFWVMLAPASGSAFYGIPARWFGVTSIVIGVGSFLLHATLTLWGQFWDVVGMYLFSGFTLTYAFRRWRRLTDATAALLYFALCSLLIGLLITIPETRRWLFAVVLVADVAIEMIFARPRRPGVEVRWYLYGIALQLAAFAIWIADLKGVICNAHSLVQGHAAWHLLNALAVWSTFQYYRSERGTRPLEQAERPASKGTE